MMLKKIESLINHSPFYNLIRFNPFTDFIIEHKTQKVKKELAFYSSFLEKKNGKLVFDIGANKGNKINVFLKMGYRVVALEPERKALSTLYWRYKRNRMVTIVEKGVSNVPGTLTIHVTDARSGLNTLSEKWMDSLEKNAKTATGSKLQYKDHYDVDVTTIDDLVNEFGIPYFIKIDVEGFEINVIKGMTITPSYLSFETNLPEFKSDSIDIVKYLKTLNSNVKFNYSAGEMLEEKEWLDAEAISTIINDTTVRSLEIICKFK